MISTRPNRPRAAQGPIPADIGHTRHNFNPSTHRIDRPNIATSETRPSPHKPHRRTPRPQASGPISSGLVSYTSTISALPKPLILRPISGPPLQSPIEITTEHAILGRAVDCSVVLPHETVSRRHAALARHGKLWFLDDLASRHGTALNGVPLQPSKPAGLEHDDTITIGPWSFRVDLGLTTRPIGATLITPAEPMRAGAPRVERVPERELAWSAQQRLDLLINASAALYAAADEAQLRQSALAAACAGSGYPRAAWLKPNSTDDTVELLASKLPTAEDATHIAFSQSLIKEAAKGQTARLTEQSTRTDYAQSIADLGIHSALCVPISVGSAVVALLYLDARGQESPVSNHAAGFCQALSQICSLALASLRREELERRQQRLDGDLAAAREAQQFIMPPAQGRHSSLDYAMRATPGRAVAGDLFDLIPLDADRLAVVIGDVAGKSLGAGILMATTQAYLHAMLTRYQDPARALITLNQYLVGRMPPDRFITMWVGIIDARTGSVVFVDAGHGHFLLVRNQSGRAPLVERIRTVTGIPVAIDESYQYANEHLHLAPGDRLVLYSDGISEQRSPAGEEFGLDRVRTLLVASTSPAADVDALFNGVQAFAQTATWDDDATVASLTIRPAVPTT